MRIYDCAIAFAALAPGRLVRIAPPRPAVVDWFPKGNVYVSANILYLSETQGEALPENRPFSENP